VVAGLAAFDGKNVTRSARESHVKLAVA